MSDPLLTFGFLIFAVTTMAFLVIVCLQYQKCKPGTERLIVLNSRIASFLPLYSLFMALSIYQPFAYPAYVIPISIIEQYSFYCFFVMVVENLKGPKHAIEVFRSTGKPLKCCCFKCSCCPNDHVVFYQKILSWIFHLMVTRTILVIIGSIADYWDSPIGEIIYTITTTAAGIVLGVSLAHIVIFYDNVYQDCVNLHGIMKFTLLKLTVGFIVLQDTIAQYLIQAGAAPYTDDDNWTAAEKTERGYCVLVLIEFVVILIPYLYTFLAPIDISPGVSRKFAPPTADPQFTFASYCCQIFMVHDLYGELTYNEQGEGTTNKTWLLEDSFA